jgi:hypothetical protein
MYYILTPIALLEVIGSFYFLVFGFIGGGAINILGGVVGLIFGGYLSLCVIDYFFDTNYLSWIGFNT